MSSRITLSVIIPVWNDRFGIEKCINAFDAQSLDREMFEIIVVDNGSSDGTYEFLQTVSTIRVERELKTGSYAARNKGIEVSSGEYLVFTDSDCIPSPEWLSELLKAVKSSKNIGIVAGHVEFFTDKENEQKTATYFYEQKFSMNQAEYAKNGACVTANWCSPSYLVKKLGMFDATLKSGGDHELAKRIVSSNYLVKYVESAVVFHPARDFEELVKKSKRVVGGVWDKTNSKYKLLAISIGECKRFLRKLLWAFSLRGIGFLKRIDIIVLLIKLYLSIFHELIKLYLGKQSARS